jgi:hypothetical protein
VGVRKTRHVCECYTDIFSEGSLFKIEESIFAPNRTVELPSAMMSEESRSTNNEGIDHGIRFKSINFENLSSFNQQRDDKPLTLEFRQHESITDPTAIKHWIIFVLSLVRAAERKAKQLPSPTSLSTTNLKRFRTYAQRHGQKYHMVSHTLDGHLEDLSDLLDFQDHQRKYWLGRLKEVKPGGIRGSESPRPGVLGWRLSGVPWAE